MKFAPAKKNHRISCPNCSPAQVFHEIFKNRCFMKNRWSTITPSPAIHLLHFIDLWHHRNVFELQKILLTQTNVHVSRNPTICDQKVPTACRAFVRKIALALVLLYKLALYESCVRPSATPQSNEIRASEEISSNFMPKRFTSVNFFIKFWKIHVSWKTRVGEPYGHEIRWISFADANFIVLRCCATSHNDS